MCILIIYGVHVTCNPFADHGQPPNMITTYGHCEQSLYETTNIAALYVRVKSQDHA